MTTETHTAAARPGPAEQAVLDDVIGMLREVLGEYGLEDAEVTMDTLFQDDLELESIDLVTLSTALREHYGDTVNFAAFIADRGLEEIIALTVGDLVRHVVAALSAANAAEAV
ncbi:phosphopantetheine-binding protein [Streptomyces sp. NBC_00257]|uniref:acyl carrier protein n=1 Tax=Streptomyces TaxID=1883 RepID=UPI00224E4E7E|nr:MULTISPECIES: phosphopantetheine-binding protein [unclassified Streptomyces]WSW10173.1 phosphopantetheine-binding protein [Streptomyces sp. NBC_01005]WTB59461.1 phosphopantetheine-binding protein [Streptomyces sp. NBC_00826]WTC99684.1 phosphopantetheine-binding protein [Streptomyces sp. NBC_01650]WTH87670.1 phosphopantetheine-binding protein [Streptomyces sp. NBC_00825]WTH96396.1 phosphopantetheine-binding protein [Streptomyces sp. NBC_00822]